MRLMNAGTSVTAGSETIRPLGNAAPGMYPTAWLATTSRGSGAYGAVPVVLAGLAASAQSSLARHAATVFEPDRISDGCR